MKEIIVRVMRPQRRDVYVAYWTDPVTGKRRQKSTGQTANVVVAKHKSKTKYASAHDLRRSFGLSMATRFTKSTQHGTAKCFRQIGQQIRRAGN